VLLISDGLANVGLTDSALIRIKVQKFKDDEGISLSTFGVGLDYNETLMTDMAETGAGNYYFIDAADKLSQIFNKELHGLMNIAAQNAELRIKLPQGVKILKGYPLRFQQTADTVIVKLRDLSSEETKSTIFTFSIDKNVSSVLKFSSTITYTDVVDGSIKSIANENVLIPVKNVDAYLTHFNRQVIEQSILFTVNEKLETAMNLMEKGDYNGAKKFINENSAYLKAHATYVNGYSDLMKIDSLNSNYQTFYYSASSVSADSLKKVQKANKAENYRLRNKKQ
jgi:Ca-activated chloride channel homolog